jgi:hypothetical protein
MRPTRPTLRCLHDDLHMPLPPVSQPLDEIDHPLLRKAGEQFTEVGTPHERVAAIDDQILFKVKVQRWRGAVWVEPDQPWLVAAGWREDGSPDDFYAALAADAHAARARYNAAHPSPLTTRTHVAHLLPDAADRDRYQAESGIRLVRRLQSTVHDLVRASLRDGSEHLTQLDTFTLGIQVRAEYGHETYVTIVGVDPWSAVRRCVPGSSMIAGRPAGCAANCVTLSRHGRRRSVPRRSCVHRPATRPAPPTRSVRTPAAARAWPRFSRPPRMAGSPSMRSACY